MKIKSKKVRALLVNTRNANAFTGAKGFKSLVNLADSLSVQLSEKNKIDDENPVKLDLQIFYLHLLELLVKNFLRIRSNIAFQN